MKKASRLFFNPIFYLALIIILAFIVRLYKIDSPVADWHSWRQADTAAVARNFYKLGYSPFVPIYDDMSAVSQGGQVNPNRYRFVEFPIYESLIYFTYLLNGGIDERLARLVSIVFSLGSIVFIYLLTKEFFGKATALLAALLFAILPYSIYYSRVILPEPSLVFFSLGMLYFTHHWIWQNRKKDFIISVAFAACAFLTKPTAIFYAIPLLYDFYQKEKKIWPINPRYFLWIILAVLPFGLWRVWIGQHPEGIPASTWLLNGNGIRWKPVFWWWILWDRFGREILGVTGTFLFFFGLFIKPKSNEGWLLHLLALSMFGYLITFATGNVQHDYYQTLIIPALVILVARASVMLICGENFLVAKIITVPFVILFLVMIEYSTWLDIAGLYQINNFAIVEAGRAADKILPKNTKVIAPYNGDTAFLYQTNRPGFAYNPTSFEDIRDKYGIDYLVSVAKDKDTQYAMQHYTVLVNTKNYVIVDLTAPK